MTIEMVKSTDNNNDEISRIVRQLADIVEQEVNAFQSLYDALLDQQTVILRGDALSVAQSNEDVEAIVVETKKLERERMGKSQDLSRCLDVEEGLSLSDVLPLVEQRYTQRLEELKQMLQVLAKKIQSTNKRNKYLLEHSLQFVDNCLRILVEGSGGDIAYGRTGKVMMRENSLYSGVG
jgi:flagellar biosynthesis/type III secretory pathway chaperone